MQPVNQRGSFVLTELAVAHARSAAKFDQQPVLKALICRHPDVHPHLPANLDRTIATFLGGELRTHYLPSGAGRTDSLRAAVLAMYRSPVCFPAPFVPSVQGSTPLAHSATTAQVLRPDCMRFIGG
jgi:hypothetical protein